MSHRTIEDTIAVAITHGLTSQDGSQKLRKPTPLPDPPTIDQVGRAYANAGYAKWPSKFNRNDRHQWWRSLLCISLFTGFRLSDLVSLRWCAVSSGSIRHIARKTNKLHSIPLHPIAEKHLAETPRSGDTIFGLTACHRQLRRELKSISGGIIRGPQQMRQASMLMWWHAGGDRAVEIVHGTGIRGVLAHYLAAEEILKTAIGQLRFPDEMLPESERQKEEEEATELLRRFKMAPSATRRLMLDLSRKLA